MNILVIGGMHGNEPLGLEVIDLFKKNPTENVSTLFANILAIKANTRYTFQDLNRSFPGNIKSKLYEERRAAEITEICKKYDLVIDFHNTHCSNNDCSFVGKSAQQNLFKISQSLGLNKIIVADYDCLNKYAPNCISVEVSLDSDRRSPELWYKLIFDLAVNKKVNSTTKIQKFSFVYRITLKDKRHYTLEDKNLKAFVPLDPELANKLGVSNPAYPIFVGDKYTPYNYGGLLNEIE
jgi:hypothetical protein